MKRLAELQGKKFNRWMVLGLGTPNSGGQKRLLCRCDCGIERSVDTYALERGVSKSCGCYKAEVTSGVMSKHRMSNTVEYRAFAAMLDRCYNENGPNYEDYGFRGITVCEEFRNDFLNFYKDIGPKPIDGRRWSVGRMNNNAGYNVGNVRWETDSQQARNHSLQTNNTSGISGITIRRTLRDGDRVVARYNDLDGKRISKSFAFHNGDSGVAMELARTWRNENIERLNLLGADYAASHGTLKEISND